MWYLLGCGCCRRTAVHRDGPDSGATRPITVYSGSMPFEKKKLRLGASVGMPREQ